MHNKYRLIAIIRNVEPENAVAIVKTLLEEGIHCIEVSLSEAERGFGCLQAICTQVEDERLHLGAGTVSTTAEVDKLIEIGIKFFVTPGFDAELADYAIRRGIEVIPGVLTPSDVQQAKNRGITLVKLFPADAHPIGYVKSLGGPFPHMRFLAVGGVGAGNLGEYLAAGFCGVGIGGSLVPQNAGPQQLEAIRKEAARCVKAAAERG